MCAIERAGELSDSAVHRSLVEVQTFEHLKFKLLQCGRNIRGIVLGIGERACVLIGGISDDEGHPSIRRGATETAECKGKYQSNEKQCFAHERPPDCQASNGEYASTA